MIGVYFSGTGNKKIVIKDKCTMCYRCISQCPEQDITLLGDKVVQQYNYERKPLR